jgi:hypothetical protein
MRPAHLPSAPLRRVAGSELVRVPAATLTGTRALVLRRARSTARADVNGVYTGECTTYALSGFVRGQGEADAALDRLWAKETGAAAASGKFI